MKIKSYIRDHYYQSIITKDIVINFHVKNIIYKQIKRILYKKITK